MYFHGIPTQGKTLTAQAHGQAHAQTDHTPFWQRALSRRQFAHTTAGAVVGTALGSGVWAPGVARARRPGEPVPIPGECQAGGQAFHVFGPGLNGNPPEQEPATITDFYGFIGLAYHLNGMVTQTARQTGETRRLPFLTSDMRFMQGICRDTEGRMHQGAFAVV